MNTLIITDVQNDFLPGGALEVPNSGDIIAVVNEIQSLFDLVVATQDWHPLNHKSFACNNPGKKINDIILLNDLEQRLWPPHCVQDTYGAELSDKLLTLKIEAIIRKGTNPEIDSYSTFYDNGHKKSTGLTGYLRDRGAKNLFFCGLAADFCVYYSIIDALGDGFNCTLITDATYPIDIDNYPNVLQKMIKQNVSIITSNDLLNS